MLFFFFNDECAARSFLGCRTLRSTFHSLTSVISVSFLFSWWTRGDLLSAGISTARAQIADFRLSFFSNLPTLAYSLRRLISAGEGDDCHDCLALALTLVQARRHYSISFDAKS